MFEPTRQALHYNRLLLKELTNGAGRSSCVLTTDYKLNNKTETTHTTQVSIQAITGR